MDPERLLVIDSRGRARFGVLVPFTNTNLEPDMALMRPRGVSLHFARMGGYELDEVPDEKQMQAMGAAELDEPLRLLTGARPDIVLYGCTSATLTLGPDFDRSLAERIKREVGAETVTAAGALVHALKTLGATRIGYASPYVPAINDLAVTFFADLGVRTVNRSEVAETLDNEGQGALTPDDVFELGLRADCAEADAIVLSCTDMRSIEAIARLEARIGKPVISSNQAMQFQALQHLGVKDRVDGFGGLLERAR